MLNGRAVTGAVEALHSALDSEQYVSAVGAAKDFAEAACKVAIEHAGGTVPGGATLPTLFKDAVRPGGGDAERSEVGRSVAATVQRLTEQRNRQGAGHGRSNQPEVSPHEAFLASTAAFSIALFALDPPR
jgi:hypothetical protein